MYLLSTYTVCHLPHLWNLNLKGPFGFLRFSSIHIISFIKFWPKLTTAIIDDNNQQSPTSPWNLILNRKLQILNRCSHRNNSEHSILVDYGNTIVSNTCTWICCITNLAYIIQIDRIFEIHLNLKCLFLPRDFKIMNIIIYISIPNTFPYKCFRIVMNI